MRSKIRSHTTRASSVPSVCVKRRDINSRMYVSTRLGRWYYEEHGKGRDGEAIVLWHSFLCDGGMWDGQIDTLARTTHVRLLDGPGHEKSEAPPPFSLDDNAR